MSQRISVAMAADILGVSKQFIRVGLIRGELPIGSAVKTSSKYTYHISPGKLKAYLNAELEVNEMR